MTYTKISAAVHAVIAAILFVRLVLSLGFIGLVELTEWDLWWAVLAASMWQADQAIDRWFEQ